MSNGSDDQAPVSPELVAILVCPESKQPLRLARADELAALNTRLREGALRNRGGAIPTAEFREALVREDGRRAYPVDDGIPVMLIEESVDL